MSDYFGGDDELIERLRQTLHAEAAALRPSPEEKLAGRYQAPGRVLPFRPRWPHALITVAAAAAIAIAVIEWPGSGHPVRTVTPATTPSPVGRTPSPTTVPPPLNKNSPATAPRTTRPIVRVPASFQPQSVTFVSSDTGWALGTVHCGSGSCLSLANTRDGGHTWASTPSPSALVASGATFSVRFANGVDGWVYLNNPSGGFAQMWSTHDGGSTWRPVTIVALSGGQIDALEVSGGTARLVILSADVHIDLLSSPVGTDEWTPSSVQIPLGAGPVPSAQLVLQRNQGWVIENDRTVVGAAELNASGQWQAWNPPCANANGAASLAASSPDDVVAICDEGTWGTPGQAGATPNSQWLFRSSDGGASFAPVGPLPSSVTMGPAITTSAPGTIVGGGAVTTGQSVHATNILSAPAQEGGLVATFDGGQTWKLVFPAAATTNWVDVGFTNLLQGVAVGVTHPGTDALLMTHDGGHTWAPVDFGIAP